MALLQVNHLTKFYGSDAIFTDLNLEINFGEKWGLIGKNGCGKTTLINILTGFTDYDRGEIHWTQNCRAGYLQQEPVFQGTTLFAELRLVFRELERMQERMAELQTRLNEPGVGGRQLERLIAEFTHLNEQFELQGGYRIEGRIQGVLRGLGFPKERWDDSPYSLSGGERTRLALARILLTDNDLLFLDEPTNYLDLAAIEWLERYLVAYRGAVLVISHDRYFLDQVASGFFEIEAGQASRFRGNYTAYRQAKAEQYDAVWKAYLKQEQRITRLEKLVREARATEKSKRQAKSIAKRLEKEPRIAKPPPDTKKMKMELKTVANSGQLVLEAENIAKTFGSKPLLKGVHFKLGAGEKVGLIGPNGVGKTTLLKILLELEAPDEGSVRFGYEVYPGYFSQLSSDDDLEGTPFSQIMTVADLDNTEARTLLGRFLFSGDDVFKPMKALSGGERRRLGLLKLMLSPANFLIMDEPTNHLDLQSIEVIEAALTAYEGTVLAVSHDRYFLNKIVRRYLALINGQIHEFGSYQEYLDFTASPPDPAVVPKPKPQTKVQRELAKERQRQLRKTQKDLADTETEIERAEKRLEAIRELLKAPEVHSDYQKSWELSNEMTALEQRLETLYEKWETLQEALS
ncbi:MAG: ABC-F family ATP-binding cassette domain-containing protein [Bacillota bacterium]|jgi:ATP-binding cassette subfamily F protein 3